MATTRTREGVKRSSTKAAPKGEAAPKARTARKPAEGARPKLGSSHTTRTTKARAAGGARPAPARGASGRPASRAAVVTDATPAPKRGPGALAPKRGQAAPAARPPAEEGPTKEARERALTVAAAGLDKKALNVEIIDVVGRADYADYLVLMTGNSDRHVASIVQAIEEDARKRGSRALSVEGMPAANWVLIDLADVVVHVFQEEARGLYDIDGLWMDAKRVPPPSDAQGPNGRAR
ncbi:MAG TPA: ribosome silencing factor [Polyangiaceae bacterium]|nr:ribosome silencing factor [Polyangiaceae bacterium]